MNSKFERAEQGFSLLELLLGVVMMAMVIVGVAAIVSRQGDEAKANVVALQLKTIGDAAGEYIKDNYNTLLADTAPANSKVIITLAMLTNTGYLGAGFNPANSFNQNMCVVVRRSANSANNLLGLVVTEGGNAIDDVTLGQIAATIGGPGGGVYGLNPAQVTGALGSWNFPVGTFAGATIASTLTGSPAAGTNCSGGAGNVTLAAGHPTMSLWFADGASRSASGTLYRNAVAGQPDLNTMNTALLTGTGAIIPDTQIGQACNTGSLPNVRGAIATAEDGSVVSCVNNIWVKTDKYWGAAVDVVGNLGTCDASKAGATRMVKSTAGAAFNAHPYVPYTCDGTGTWKPIALDQNGNFRVAGAFEVDGATQLHNSLHVGGNTDIDGGLEVDNSAVLHNSLHVGGHATFDGDVTLSGSASGILNLKSYMVFQNQVPTATVNTGCTDVGNGKGVTMTTDGDILTCKNGVWKKTTGGFTEKTIVTSPSRACGAGAEAFATCPSGYVLSGGGYALSWWAGNQYTSNAPDSSHPREDLNAWVVWGGGKTTDGHGNALACFYAYAVCLR